MVSKGYIEREGKAFGLEIRLKVYEPGKEHVGEQVDETTGSLPYALSFFCKLWAWRRGHGWLPLH